MFIILHSYTEITGELQLFWIFEDWNHDLAYGLNFLLLAHLFRFAARSVETSPSNKATLVQFNSKERSHGLTL